MMIIAIDIGTSYTHIGLVDTGELSCVGRVDIENTEFDDRFLSSLKKIISDDIDIRGINITSCVKRLAEKARKICVDEKLSDSVNIVKPRGNEIGQNYYNEIGRNYDDCDDVIHSLQINYNPPDSLGTDRLCNALACSALYGGADCVIVDVGTAITIDFLRDGTIFEGGVILPGISMQLNALHERTDGLPLVNITHKTTEGSPLVNATAVIPATSTNDCIKSGVLYGTAGAVVRCVYEYLKTLDEDKTVFIAATGGGLGIIKNYINIDVNSNFGIDISIDIDINIDHCPDLTLLGAAIYSPL